MDKEISVLSANFSLTMSMSRTHVLVAYEFIFAIIHIDLWMPGKYTDSKGNMELMNAMCDISQFVVIVPVTNESSTTITENCF